MAFRRPVKLDGSNLRNMTDAEILLLQQEAIRQHGLNPAVTLTYDAGNGTLATIPDYRYQAGPLASGSSPWPTPTQAGAVTVNYNHTVLSNPGESFPSRGNQSYSNFSYPVYLDGGDIRPMTTQDYFDTIITPAKDYLITNEGTDDNLYRAGTYTIHTTNSLSGATLVDANPIFSDTQADVTAFNAGSLPEVQDQPLHVQHYYLHRFDPVAGIDYVPPVVQKIDTYDLQSMPSVEYSSLTANLMRWNTLNGVDYTANVTRTKYIRYQYWPVAGAGATALPGTTADARGSSMANTLTGLQTIRYEQPNSTTYYAQYVPVGAATAYTTWNLIIAYIDNTGAYQ